MSRIANSLSNTGWDVTVLCPVAENYTFSNNGGIKYYTFSYPTPSRPSSRLLNSIRGAKTLRECLQEYSFDVILDDVSPIPFFPAHIFNETNTVNAMFLHIAYLDTRHTNKSVSKSNVTAAIHKFLPKINNPFIICAGPSTEARVQTDLDHDRTAVLSPCVNVHEYEFTFDPSAHRVLYLGRLTERKNVSCLLDAWVQLDDMCTDYLLTIAGTGPKESMLKQQARQLGISNVEFKGYVDEKEKRRLYNDSLLYVLPSRLEGYATVGLEALAAGTPVVGADTAGINDYITPNETGYLFENNNSDNLAKTLRRTLTEPETLESIARNGRKIAEQHSCSHFGRKADAVFTRVATSR